MFNQLKKAHPNTWFYPNNHTQQKKHPTMDISTTNPDKILVPIGRATSNGLVVN
jgi:hypothetical protein